MPVSRVRKTAKPAAPADKDTEFVVEEGEPGVPFTVTLGPLSIELVPMNANQWAVLAKVVQGARRRNENVRAVEVFFQIVSKLMVDPDRDSDALDDALIDGTVTVDEVAQALRIEGVSGAEKQTTARTRRGQ